MFERFGEFDSAEELNLTAEGLKTEGDMESLLILAEENGIDKEDAEDYMGMIHRDIVSWRRVETFTKTEMTKFHAQK